MELQWDNDEKSFFLNVNYISMDVHKKNKIK